jgi:hypothetical protein
MFNSIKRFFSEQTIDDVDLKEEDSSSKLNYSDIPDEWFSLQAKIQDEIAIGDYRKWSEKQDKLARELKKQECRRQLGI